ncbi:MAG: hypothetical protein Q9219_002407 [cf. Caloplaca sp. 3 TL-2023]
MHLLSGLVTGLLVLGSPTRGAPSPDHNSAVKGRKDVRVLGQRSPNVETPHILNLSRETTTISPSATSSQRHGNGNGNGTVGLTSLTPYKDIVYFTDITFGTETFKAVVDTGSADTWLIQSGFQCVTRGRFPVTLPEASCRFGPQYIPSTTFKQLPEENFNTTYADGEVLTGIVGTERVTLGGITVENQQIGLVNYAAWNGDNSSSGLIGLAFPNITSVFSGSNPALDSESTALAYSPLFTSMYSQGLVAPVFSLAIERGEESGGLLALGGLPPVRHSPYFACAPFQKRALRGQTSSDYQYYYINIDGLTYGNQSKRVNLQADIDSGTSLIFLPSETAYEINKLFDPPAVVDGSRGQYVVDCAAKAPRFGISIGHHTFYINPQDLVIKTQDGSCITGITESGLNRPGVLGDVFLKNVLAVFDIGASEMRFAAREFY